MKEGLRFEKDKTIIGLVARDGNGDGKCAGTGIRCWHNERGWLH